MAVSDVDAPAVTRETILLRSSGTPAPVRAEVWVVATFVCSSFRGSAVGESRSDLL
jgi:hypothetical protein